MEMLLLEDKSTKPKLWKIILPILMADFVLAIVYGIAMEGPRGNMDAQMDYAPIFLLLAAVVSVFAFYTAYKYYAKFVTSVRIYDDRVDIEGYLVDSKGKFLVDGREVGGGIGNTGEKKGKLTNAQRAQLAKDKQSQKYSVQAEQVSVPIGKIYTAVVHTRYRDRVIIITVTGQRYLLVRMDQAEQIAKVICDKLGR